MRIDFECSGGYVPLDLAYRVDTEELPEELAEELLQLVDSSGAFDFQESPGPTGFPDMISYKLSVSEGGMTKSVSVNDATSGTLHPLLTRLRQLALEERGRRR